MSEQQKFCCEELRRSVSLERSLLFYHPIFDEYGIPFTTSEGFSYMTIGYCPWCGKELPLSKREQWIKAQKEAAAQASESDAETC